jgi:signal peptidase I
MEARLFWISLACGAYGLLLRQVLKNPSQTSRRTLPLFHALFTGAAGGLGGMLAASYLEQTDNLWTWSLAAAVPGFIIGLIWVRRKSQETESFERLLMEDLEWADTGFSAILLASVIMYGVVQAFKIPSGSMRMTFLEGDHLFVNKFIYGVPIPLTHRRLLVWKLSRPVRRGDIIIFRFPSEDSQSTYYGKDFIKRVIGLPGDKMEIRQKSVFVNGQPLQEPYAQHFDPNIYAPVFSMRSEEIQRQWETGDFARMAGQNLRDNFGPVVVPPHHYFMMGDNRDASFDSRFWGPLPDPYIKGKAWLLYWPFGRLGFAR